MEGDPAERRHRLLVLGAGPAQLGLLAAARARGHFVIAVDRDPGAPGFRYADRRALVSTEDERGVERLARAEGIDGLIAPGIDWPVAIAARVAERLGLTHPLNPATAAATTSKLRQRERLAEAGVDQPGWRVVAVAEPGLELPCVVKAPDRQGQRGLSVVRERVGLAPAIAEAVAASRSGTALVEQLVEGPEVTVNAFSIEGSFHPLTVTDRLTGGPEAFGVALAHLWPSREDPKQEETEFGPAAALAERAAAAIGVRNGPTYTQVRLGPDGPRLIELAARLGGGHDAELCDAALGVDLNALALAAALGEPIPAPALEPSAPAGGACVRFLVAPPGELVDVAGIERALELEGVLEARAYRGPGWRFGPLRRGADRAGFVLVRGDSAEDALARADRAADLIRFETSDAEALV